MIEIELICADSLKGKIPFEAITMPHVACRIIGRPSLTPPRPVPEQYTTVPSCVGRAAEVVACRVAPMHQFFMIRELFLHKQLEEILHASRLSTTMSTTLTPGAASVNTGKGGHRPTVLAGLSFMLSRYCPSSCLTIISRQQLRRT